MAKPGDMSSEEFKAIWDKITNGAPIVMPEKKFGPYDSFSDIITKHGFPSADLTKLMQAKVEKANNPVFMNTVYEIEENSDRSKPVFDKNGIGRVADTFDKYNHISDAVKLLIDKLGMKAKK